MLFTTSILNISQPNGFTFVVSLYHTTTWIYQENLRTSPLKNAKNDYQKVKVNDKNC